MNKSKNNLLNRYPVTMYFILAFTISWLIFSPGVAANLGMLNFRFDGTVLTILGGLGPFIAAIIVTRATDGKTGVAKLFRNMFNWRVKPKWWVAGALLVAGLFILSAILNMLLGGSVPNPADGLYLNGRNLIPVILLLLFGSFTEEPGWRGFALPRLQQNQSPMMATFILTVFWWLWHLPTYWTMPAFMDSSQEYGFMVAFGIQFVVLLTLGLLCAWVYNGSSGSVLMPVLMHASWNFWSGAFGQEASLFLMPLFLLAAVAVGLLTRGNLGLTAMDKT